MVYKIYWKLPSLLPSYYQVITKFVQSKEEKESLKPDRDPKKEFWLQNDLYHLKLEEKTLAK